jgi:general secretion pathway protein J
MSSLAPRPRACAREGGFTLIELLVSLTILSVILGLLSGGLRVISKNWDVNAARIERLDMVARAADILRRDAAGMQRLVAMRDGGGPRYVFSGSQNQLEFVTLEPPYPSAAGPYFVSYSVAPNGPEADLIRARAPYRQGLETFPGATPANRVPLVEGPYRYRFAYAEKSAGASAWRTSWSNPTRLPDLIRLQILDARNVPVAASLVVALRADAELGCLAEKAEVCSAKSGGALKANTEKGDDNKLRDNGSKGEE